MAKAELHARNRHREPYNFKQLITHCSQLAKFVRINSYGNESIDFSDPKAVKALNQAILKGFYNIIWDIPEHFLCPPIPGRADYVHYLADLIGEGPRLILDVGVGANCIYPLLGYREYGWKFVGSDIDPAAISNANKIIGDNKLSQAIEIRLQTSPSHIFEGIVNNDIFDACLSNPPFHSSLAEAKAGTMRKWKNLKIKTKALNFGGKCNELWCPGGEAAFIKRMIAESVYVKCKWFTALVSKSDSLPSLYKALESVNPMEVKTINMGQGQKKSRILAWRFR